MYMLLMYRCMCGAHVVVCSYTHVGALHVGMTAASATTGSMCTGRSVVYNAGSSSNHSG
jgi:hypothetical protein